MRRSLSGSAWIAAALCALASACGGASTPAATAPTPIATSQTADVLERQFGKTADGFYLLTPRKRSWSGIVVFVHGHGGPSEITPVNHRPWLRHLAARGSAVVYPRYEQVPGGHGAARHIDAAVRAAATVLGLGNRRVPIVGIGYSRGGRLVVDWGALAAPRLKPGGILSVFPASAEELSPDPSGLAPGTRIHVLIGDKDEVVGAYGAAALLTALDESGFGSRLARWTVLKSTPGFPVTHLSALESSKRAQALFWEPADRLIAEVG